MVCFHFHSLHIIITIFIRSYFYEYVVGVWWDIHVSNFMREKTRLFVASINLRAVHKSVSNFIVLQFTMQMRLYSFARIRCTRAISLESHGWKRRCWIDQAKNRISHFIPSEWMYLIEISFFIILDKIKFKTRMNNYYHPAAPNEFDDPIIIYFVSEFLWLFAVCHSFAASRSKSNAYNATFITMNSLFFFKYSIANEYLFCKTNSDFDLGTASIHKIVINCNSLAYTNVFNWMRECGWR